MKDNGFGGEKFWQVTNNATTMRLETLASPNEGRELLSDSEIPLFYHTHSHTYTPLQISSPPTSIYPLKSLTGYVASETEGAVSGNWQGQEEKKERKTF